LPGHKVRTLLDTLCVDLGFCLAPDAIARLCDDPPPTSDEFTDAVFRLEGLDPTTADRHVYRQVRAVVARAFHDSHE
jgi:hypothetical protein